MIILKRLKLKENKVNWLSLVYSACLENKYLNKVVGSNPTLYVKSNTQLILI